MACPGKRPQAVAPGSSLLIMFFPGPAPTWQQGIGSKSQHQLSHLCGSSGDKHYVGNNGRKPSPVFSASFLCTNIFGDRFVITELPNAEIYRAVTGISDTVPTDSVLHSLLPNLRNTILKNVLNVLRGLHIEAHSKDRVARETPRGFLWEKTPRLYIKRYFRLLVKQPNVKFIIFLDNKRNFTFS